MQSSDEQKQNVIHDAEESFNKLKPNSKKVWKYRQEAPSDFHDYQTLTPEQFQEFAKAS